MLSGSRPFRCAVLLAAIAILVGACAGRPAAVVSPVSPPPSFSPSGEKDLPEQWWRSFGDADLDRLVEMALGGSFTLRQAWDRLTQAQAIARKVGASLYPNVDAQAGAGGSLSDKGRMVELNVGLAARYEVDLWGRLRAERDAERLAVLASQEDLVAAAISLSAEVALAWFKLLERRAQLNLLKAQHELSSQVLAVVALQYGQGLGAAADILQQRQNLESLVGDEATMRGQVQVLEHQLAVLVGRPPGVQVASARDTLPLLPALPRAGIPSELIGRRPDLRSALRRVEEADRRTAAAVADRWPRLSLSAGVSTSAGYGPPFLWGWLVNLAANLVAPLVDGGARRAEVDRARARAAELLNRYGQVALVALREVEDALTKEHNTGRLVDSLERQLQLSAAVVDQVRGRYLQGAEEYLRVLDAVLRHQALERSLLVARWELLAERVALCRALAGGWKMTAPTSTGTPEAASRANASSSAVAGRAP